MKKREMSDSRLANLLWRDAQMRERAAREIAKQPFDGGYGAELVVGDANPNFERAARIVL
jgi:hypothetical protein